MADTFEPTSGPVTNKEGFKLEVDRDLCVTLAVCLGVAPDIYSLDAEGKAIIKDPALTNLETILESAKACPVNAIVLHHPNGTRIWPDPEVNLQSEAI